MTSDWTRLLTTAQVARMLGVDPSQVRRYVLAKRLSVAHRTPGGHARIRLAEVERFRESRETRH